MRKHLKYLSYIIRHKWYVALACFNRGLIWRGLVHDWSKFLPSEWLPYVEFFYGEKFTDEQIKERWRQERVVCGLAFTKSNGEKQEEFDLAWLMHQHRNPHHWQHWVLRNDNGTTAALRMPHDCVLEMLADWEGAGMAITGRREYVEWYLKNREKMVFHPETKRKVEELLGV